MALASGSASRLARGVRRCVGMLLLGLLIGSIAPASAQTPAADSAAGPALELSAAQKQTIYQSVSTTQKNNPAPPGFRATIGAQVPDAIELQPISKTLASLIPQTADHDVAMVEKQVVLVDPKTKRVVAVVSQE
jgi:hypothetical protein